jgi:hypothetical protein
MQKMKNDDPAAALFPVSDFYAAAFLICSGLDLVRTERVSAGRVVFLLRDKPQRMQMLQSFDTLYKELPPHKQRKLLAFIIQSITVKPTHIEMALFGRASLERFTLAGGVFARSTNWQRDYPFYNILAEGMPCLPDKNLLQDYPYSNI